MGVLEQIDAKKVRIAWFYKEHSSEIEGSKPGEQYFRLKILFDVSSEFSEFCAIFGRSSADETLKCMSMRALERLIDAILYEISLL